LSKKNSECGHSARTASRITSSFDWPVVMSGCKVNEPFWIDVSAHRSDVAAASTRWPAICSGNAVPPLACAPRV
jgi:hypothetical protein